MAMTTDMLPTLPVAGSLTRVRIGVLTSGGDCPGLNAVLRAVVRVVERVHGGTVLGFRDAWRGVMEDDWEVLDVARCRGILPRGGTIIGTSRIQPYATPDGVDLVRAAVDRHRLDGFIVIGGEGSLSCAADLQRDGIPCVGVPKTIDNDVVGTERTFGFDTAVAICSSAIDRLHSTAESHDRVMFVEVMGRHVGHIALHAGLAGGATMTLIPEVPVDMEAVAGAIARRHSGLSYASIVVVAEGAEPAPGTLPPMDYQLDAYGRPKLGGISTVVAAALAERTGYDTRVVQIGHVQRGGTPNAFDRVLCTRLGVAATEALHAGRTGNMVALRNDDVVLEPLETVKGKTRFVDLDLYDGVASVFFG